MKHLVIAGAGEFGRELFWSLQESVGYNEIFDIKGYVDDSFEKEKIAKLQKPYLGKINEYQISENDVFTCAIANPFSKEKVVNSLLDRGAKFINVIHKTAIIHGTVNIGQGAIICQYTSISDCSSIGDFFTLNGLSAIGHDCQIADYVSIMSHCSIMGHTKIGRCSFVGGGVETIPKVKIGNNAYVGAGSVVLRKVKDGSKVFGNPAKPI